jgi:hypothetical protein
LQTDVPRYASHAAEFNSLDSQRREGHFVA